MGKEFITGSSGKVWVFLVVLILLAALFVVGLVFDRPAMTEYEKFQDAAIFFTSALPTLLLGLSLRRRKGRGLIDEASGEKIILRSRHTLFFIPVLFWPVIFAGAGIGFLLR